MSQVPERHVVVEIKLGSDSIRDAINALDQIAFWLTEIEDDIENGSGRRESVTGGPGAGYTVTVRANPGVTQDSYHLALKEYLAEKRREAEASTDG